MSKLTIGYRVRIKYRETDSLNLYEGHEAILTERSRGCPEFSVLVLREGKNIPLERNGKTVINELAWLHEDDLELIDTNIEENIKFFDWYAEAEDYLCPDCGHLNEEGDEECSKCGCEL